jgi:methionine-rich copper-binding protein CopC
MLLGAYIVLLLGLGFFLPFLPRSVPASPASMPTTACLALASRSEQFSTFSSAALSATARLARPFSTQNIAAHSLVKSGYANIGTATSLAPLTISFSDNSFGSGVAVTNTNTGSNATGGYIMINSDGNNAGISYPNNAYSYSFPGTAIFYSNTGLAFEADNVSGGSPTHDISFALGSLTAMTIKSSGNVGIGTTDPDFQGVPARA